LVFACYVSKVGGQQIGVVFFVAFTNKESIVKLSKLFLYTCMSLGLTVGTSAQGQIIMRNAISVVENSHAGEAVVTLTREVEKRTNGRIVIKNFYSGSLGGEREVMESVQLGT